jgi:hypothetical protein
MNCRIRNVALLLFVFVLATGLASAQRTPQIPALYSSSGNPLLQPWNVRAEFEGPNTADFFNSINNPASPNASLMANPQIAVGPDEMLLVANSQIWRLPNGVAPGVIPTGLYPGAALIGGQAFGAQRASLDNWIGAAALANLCPTGNTDPSGLIDSANTRSAVSCQIDNATVTYDQMHGRFLVLFTVVDTGMTFDVNTQSFRLTRPRKASWVLVVSQFAVLVDQACFQGTTTSAGCTPPIPGSGVNAAGSFAFITPTPSSGIVTGGINTSIWRIVYGNDLTALGGDGFGSNKASGAGAWVGSVGVGNINSLPAIAGSSDSFDCRPGAVAAINAVPATVCYLPTGARIGVDNDTVTITSPVINGNINGANLSLTYDPTGLMSAATPPVLSMPGYAGTRVRVIKKTGLYQATPALAAANQYAALLTDKIAGTYYDMFTSTAVVAGVPTAVVNVPPIPWTLVLNNVDCQPASQPNLANEDSISAAGAAGPPAGLGTTALCRMTPVFFEPAHLRGRAQASFSNLMIPGYAPATSQTYLVGAVSSPVAQRRVYVQGVQEITGASIPTFNFFGNIPFYPYLTGLTGITTNQPNGVADPVALPSTFANPDPVSQSNFRAGEIPGSTVAPNLFVGDSRPHNVIFREGYLYDARVVTTTPAVPVGTGQNQFPQASLSTTTKYEIIEKLCSPFAACPAFPAITSPTCTETLGSPNLTGACTTAAVLPGMAATAVGIPSGAVVLKVLVNASNVVTAIVLSANATQSGSVTVTFGKVQVGNPYLVYQQYWQNTNAFAPMFDIPANVVTFGVGTPYNALNFLEKLFVATTVPPLAGLPDTLYATAPAGTPTALLGDFGFGDPRTRITYGASGLTPTQLAAGTNCYSNQLSPGGPISGQTNNPRAWASLWDTRCGVDVTDTNPQVRDPYTGRVIDMSVTQANPAGLAAYTFRGGEAIDPNDGSLWNFGAYAMKRDASVTALAHWGTFGANYKLSFPSTDVYGNTTVLFSDIAGVPEQNFIQIAINNGLVPSLANAAGIPVAPPNSLPIPFAGVNSVLYGTAAGAMPIPAGVTPPGNAPAAGTFGLNDLVTRREMAYWIVKSIMDDNAINVYLQNTASLNGVVGTGASAASFADVPTTDSGWRYIEVMARKGYTSGCFAGVTRQYCPDYISTRRDLAAFMIRAKFGNVFGSALSGCAFNFTNGTTSPANSIFPPAITTTCNSSDSGDNFALFVTGLPYFTDNPTETGNFWYPFLQKMRELRITNGTYLGPASDGRSGTYTIGANALPPVSGAGSEGNLTRRQLVTFMVRGFFL